MLPCVTTPQNGEWYLASDGRWYCWPDPTPHDGPPGAPQVPPPPPAPPTPPAPEYPSWLSQPPVAQEQSTPFTPVGAPLPGWVPPSTPYSPQAGRGVSTATPWPAYGLLGFGALLLISVFLPWVSIDLGVFGQSENGFGDGFNGIIVAIGGGLAIMSGVGWLNGRREASVGWGAAFSGLIDVFCTFEDLLDVRGAAGEARDAFNSVGAEVPTEIAGDFNELLNSVVKVGAGLYVAIIAAVGIVACAVWLALTTKDS